jgi:uncharacterized protein
MHSHDDAIIVNPSPHPHIYDVVEKLHASQAARRRFLHASSGIAMSAVFANQLTSAFAAIATAATTPLPTPSPKINLGFKSINAHFADALTVPEGYQAQVMFRWGDKISTKSAPFKQNAANTAREQALQAGMHTDGMHFFPLPSAKNKRSSERGILCVNHEYADDGLLHTNGFETWNADKVAKSQAAMGVSVVEIQAKDGRWQTNLSSRYNRRITANTVCEIRGPARGNVLMQSQTDLKGMRAKGTMANCAHGMTPWGTYLTCEENFHAMFATSAERITPEQARYGLSKAGAGYRWTEFDTRFDAGTNPNEFNHFGWVVEIDPFSPNAAPIKRTALGRFSHESATLSIAPDNRVVFYSGDDSAFEYIYKFVSAKPYNPSNRAANQHILDEGTLYVARFNVDGTGNWLPLVFGQAGLTAENQFYSQADVVIMARRAGDIVGATPMDRPEWITVHPDTRDVYCTLTNNVNRGVENKPPPDAANRRASNIMGSIIHWREKDQDPTARTFDWTIFVEAGDKFAANKDHQGNINGDAFGCPDGLWIDPNGVMWIQTDASSRQMGTQDWIGIGNNQMLACNPATGETKRFLVGPRNAEVTGVVMTPDCKTLFVGIQHPGETPSERSNPAEPKRFSGWPDYANGERPRSAVVAITKVDGGVIGT